MCIFRRKSNPDLIDLHEYEHDCMRWKRQRIPIMPPRTILAILNGNWTDEEMALMRDNRSQADEIYEAYK